MEFYDFAQKYQKQLLSEQAEWEKKYNKYPEGTLSCYKNGNSYKWFQETWEDGHHERVYIPRSKKKLAEILAEKSYCRQHLIDLEHEMKLLDHYINRHQDARNVKQLLQKHTGICTLLPQMFELQDQKLQEWQDASYEKSTNYQDNLTIRCVNGLVVRSKSEQMIVSALLKHKIPFRYECILHLGGITVAPDFTILHPITREIYYWEHFGMTDDSKYLREQFDKLDYYQQNGIFLGEKLIATFETRNQPLDERYVELMIQNYFEM